MEAGSKESLPRQTESAPALKPEAQTPPLPPVPKPVADESKTLTKELTTEVKPTRQSQADEKEAAECIKRMGDLEAALAAAARLRQGQKRS